MTLDEILAILGTKELELVVLRKRVAELETQLAAKSATDTAK